MSGKSLPAACERFEDLRQHLREVHPAYAAAAGRDLELVPMRELAALHAQAVVAF